MSLFKGSLRPPTIWSDEAIERYLTALRADVEIDPLFRRRLRGQVLNRYVVAREGLDAGQGSRHMGRVGRALLYASFSLAVTVTSVLAASQAALPGEILYPLKLQMEQVRAEVLTSRFDARLAAYALSERMGEMDRLAAAGDWEGVAGLAATIEAGYLELLAIDPGGTDATLQQHFVVLDLLLERLPEGPRSAIQSIIDRATEARGGAPGSGSTGPGRGSSDWPGDDASAGGSSDPDASPTSTRTPEPEATPNAARPDPTLLADPADATRKPKPTPRAHDPASSDAIPKATKSQKPDGS